MKVVRRLLFSLLVLWSVVDAFLSAAQGPSPKIKLTLFLVSLGDSLVFVVLIWFLWKGAERLLRKRRPTNESAVVGLEAGPYAGSQGVLSKKIYR